MADKDSPALEIYDNRIIMGQAVADAVARKIIKLHDQQKWVRIVFAAAPSQDDILAALRQHDEIQWQRIIAFHMDEYLGLPVDSPATFTYYLNHHLFNHVKAGKVHFINPKAHNPQDECERYAKLLGEDPIDIICLGIGENGHIAFNDPPVADFNDPVSVKVVDLDQKCRQQQVNDGCFPDIDSVPRQAITLTIPALMAGKTLFVTVPGPTKKEAVYHAVNDPVGTHCPATILRRHPDVTVYLDKESAELLKE